MVIVGLTGSFGTGKSTVGKIFAQFGARVIDADKIVHKITRPKTLTYRKIVNNFGRDILKKNNFIDRKKLGVKVFSSKVDLRRLCRIIHPPVINEIKRNINQIKKSNPRAIVVIDAPLLLEANLQELVDKLIVVKTTHATQIARCIKKWGFSKSEVLKRIKSQLPLREKVKLADYVVDNNLSLSYTKTQVKDIWKELKGGVQRWI